MSQVLTKDARSMMDAYAQQLAQSYGVQSTQQLFNVSPAQETKLRQAIIESAEFLKMITVSTVDQLQGQVVDLGMSALHTGRKKGGRFAKNVNVGGHKYALVETDSCAALTWEMLCQWANQGTKNQFMKLVSDYSNQMFALDKIRVGWNGIEAAETTDPDANPLGEDVNVGWNEFVRQRKAGQIITDPVVFDADGGGDYKTLDAMASDLINNNINPVFRNDPRLTVFVGSGLVSAAQYHMYDNADKPTEHIAAQQLSKDIAGRKAYTPPFFPEYGMVVTMPKNLQILTQRGTSQRKARHEEDRKQFENSYWRMEGYAVGVLEAYAAFDNASVGTGTTTDSATTDGTGA